LNKADLVARVARDTGLTKADVLRVLDGVLEAITRSLRRGGKVKLVGFGTFQVGRHRSRAGHNPRTHEPMRISARRLPKFTPGKDLKKVVAEARLRTSRARPPRPSPRRSR
jgi:DNA-binding protein HU-beta